MLVSAVVGVAILMAAIGYVIFRKFTVTRQEIEKYYHAEDEEGEKGETTDGAAEEPR